MRSLHVETGRHLYGGAQQVIYLLSGLVERGDDVLLVCPPGSEIERAAGEYGPSPVSAIWISASSGDCVR